MVARVGVEEYFLKQIVVFAEHAFGYLHVTLERCTGRILMLHYRRKHERTHERYAQRVGNGAVVLVKRIFINVQTKLMVQVFEEDTSHIVTFAYYNGVLFAELIEVCEGGTEHGMGADVWMSALHIVVFQPGFH